MLVLHDIHTIFSERIDRFLASTGHINSITLVVLSKQKAIQVRDFQESRLLIHSVAQREEHGGCFGWRLLRFDLLYTLIELQNVIIV